MIGLFQLWLGIGATRAAALAIDNNQKQQQWKDKTLCTCRDCHTEMPLGSKFCQNCRSTNLVRRKDFREEQKIAAQGQREKTTLLNQKKIKTWEVKHYYDYIRTCRYCPECSNVNPPEVKYCGQCGVQTIRVPQDYVYNWMVETYPDIVKNPNDLELLEQIPEKEEVTIGSIVAKSTISVAKGGFWVGKWFVKSIAKEISKK